MKYMKAVIAIAAFALAIGMVQAKADSKLIGHSLEQVALQIGRQPTKRFNNKFVWAFDNGETTWCTFNGSGTCVGVTWMTNSPVPQSQILDVLASEFDHMDGWKDWAIGPMHYWRDGAMNSAIYGYVGRTRQYVLSLSRSDEDADTTGSNAPRRPSNAQASAAMNRLQDALGKPHVKGSVWYDQATDTYNWIGPKFGRQMSEPANEFLNEVGPYL
jgi:hypothetical protein